MTRFILLACFSLFLLCAIPSHAQVKDRDTLIQKLVSAVRENDEQAYLKLFPDYGQIQTLFDYIISKTKDSAMREMMKQQFKQITVEQFKQKLEEELKQSFQKLIQDGREKGINWADLSYASSIIEEENLEELGGKQLSGTIQLKDADKEYSLYFSDVIWSEPHQGWFGAMLKGITRKGEKLPSIMEEFNQVDSAMMVMDTAVIIEQVPPPPPPVQKPVNKKPVEKKPVKSGTGASPATKPKSRT